MRRERYDRFSDAVVFAILIMLVFVVGLVYRTQRAACDKENGRLVRGIVMFECVAKP